MLSTLTLKARRQTRVGRCFVVALQAERCRRWQSHRRILRSKRTPDEIKSGPRLIAHFQFVTFTETVSGWPAMVDASLSDNSMLFVPIAVVPAMVR